MHSQKKRTKIRMGKQTYVKAIERGDNKQGGAELADEKYAFKYFTDYTVVLSCLSVQQPYKQLIPNQ